MSDVQEPKSVFVRRRLGELEVGEVIETGGITITDAHIMTFAGLVGDFYPLHSDERIAAASQFGGRIAHATLTLSIATGLQLQFDPLDAIAFLGLDECSFSKPVMLGDTIYVRSVLVDTRVSASKPEVGIAHHKRFVLNQRDEEVAVFQTRIMVRV